MARVVRTSLARAIVHSFLQHTKRTSGNVSHQVSKQRGLSVRVYLHKHVYASSYGQTSIRISAKFAQLPAPGRYPEVTSVTLISVITS